LTTEASARPLPHGLRDYLDDAALDDRHAAALGALAPFAPEDAPPEEWAFALEALQRSVLRSPVTTKRRRNGPAKDRLTAS